MGENCQKPVRRVMKTGSSSTPKPQVRPCNGCGLGVFQGRLTGCCVRCTMRYRLTMEPWTALPALGRNAVIFQDLDTRAICEQLFAAYPQALFRFDVQQTLPARAITTQYRESDWDFATRLLADAGLAWCVEQADGEQQAAHTLVVFDPQAQRPDVGSTPMRWCPPTMRATAAPTTAACASRPASPRAARSV
ncbi:phage late control D family protein [Xanthomonas oryzae]